MRAQDLDGMQSLKLKPSTYEEEIMAKRVRGTRRYGKLASRKVERVMRERKRGTLRSGRSGKRVTSRKQAIAIGLSEARRAGGKVPRQAK
jgi:hypothetical protein